MTSSTRPLQARAEDTRAALLQATLQTLLDVGYGGTSTAAVCRRAGVARGTLLYHFRTRDKMLVAALEHVLEARVEAFVQARRGRVLPAVDVLLMELWEQWQGPPFIAWLELAVASRTSPSLRGAMQPMMARFDALVLQAFEELDPVTGVPDELKSGVPFFVFSVFNGLAVGQCYGETGQSEPVLSMLTVLAAAWGTSGAEHV